MPPDNNTVLVEIAKLSTKMDEMSRQMILLSTLGERVRGVEDLAANLVAENKRRDENTSNTANRIIGVCTFVIGLFVTVGIAVCNWIVHSPK